jgi:glycosyltransferase involved in cell wall biosynthesis
MVLNEATAAGLPVVASDVAGASHDLIDHGVNGFRVPSEDPAALSQALRTLAHDEPLRAQARQRSLELAEAFTPTAWADAVADTAARVSRAG